MDASSTARESHWPQHASPDAASLVRAIVVCLLAFLAMAGVLLCVRHAIGALAEPLSATTLLGCGVFLTLAALGFRNAFAFPSRGDCRAIACWAAPSGVLLLWACGLSLSGSASSGLIGLWGLLLLEEGWSWGRWRSRPTCSDPTAAVAIQPQNVERVALSRDVVVAVPVAEEGEPDQAVSQQMVRRRQEDGNESIEGWVRVEFAPLQRHATTHVAICPPFARQPECFAEPMDGPSAQVKVAQVLPYGARFEIKLDQPSAEAQSMIVEFSLQEPAVDESE